MKQERKMIMHLSDMMVTKELPGVPVIELVGNRRVLIEMHKGIAEYNTEKICVLVEFGKLSITGSQLEICCMSKDQLVITGRIDSVELDRGCDKCCSH